MTENESCSAELHARAVRARAVRARAVRARAVRAGACCATLAAVAVLTAACGTATPATGARTLVGTARTARVQLVGEHAASDAARQLCDGRHPSRIKLRRLVVTLRATIPSNVPRHSAHRWTVRSVTTMRTVQRELCALPKQPKSIYNCPADFGISYRFRFHGAHGVLPAVTADATGCELVTGLGKATRWSATSPRFWPTLKRAIGLPRSA
jgi:hypothetical protein